MAILQHARKSIVRRGLIIGGLVVIGLAAVAAGSHAPVASAQSDDSEREYVTLDGTHDDVQFVAGRTVRITATVSDDVFAAGRDVTFDSRDASWRTPWDR
jgi:hypothetical protein